MQSYTLFAMSVILCMGCAPSKNTDDSASDPTGDDSNSRELSDKYVTIETSMGEFRIELDIDNAPVTTENFLRYVDDGFFDGQDGLGATLFHRVVAGFVIQGGGYTSDGAEKQTHAPIVNEAIDSGLSNLRGTLAMARTNEPDSATSQFYVNLVDNAFLDPGQSSAAGYAVFGTVTSGMDVIDSIAEVAIDATDTPLEAVVIESVYRLGNDE